MILVMWDLTSYFNYNLTSLMTQIICSVCSIFCFIYFDTYDIETHLCMFSCECLCDGVACCRNKTALGGCIESLYLHLSSK